MSHQKLCSIACLAFLLSTFTSSVFAICVTDPQSVFDPIFVDSVESGLTIDSPRDTEIKIGHDTRTPKPDYSETSRVSDTASLLESEKGDARIEVGLPRLSYQPSLPSPTIYSYKDKNTYKVECEEIIITAQRITTSAGIFWFYSGPRRFYDSVYGGGGGGSAIPGSPLPMAPQNPGNLYDNSNCNSDEVARRVHANRDIDLFLAAISPWNRDDYIGDEIQVQYNNGDTEVWTIVNPSLGSDHTAFGVPVGPCKRA